MSAMTLTEAFAEIEAINRHLTLQHAFLLALAVRPANLRDPLASAGGSAAVVAQEMQSLKVLEEHRLAVRRAVRAVAQSATITLGEQTRTIADWLEWRRKVAPGRHSLLRSMREAIQSARKQAQDWNYALPESNASARPLDIVVNIHEPDWARQSELLEETLGSLDGQLSLKSATLTIDIAPLAKLLTERETLWTTWLKQMGQEALLESAANSARTKDYTIPEEYDAYAGYGMPTVPPALRNQVRGLIVGGRKIEAIRLVRERTGWPLSQAKEAVDALS